MSDFSDKEDRLLVQLMLKYTRAASTQRIPWTSITKQMKWRKKTPKQVRNRFVTLRRRFGDDLTQFPRWFFASPAKTRQPRMKQSKDKPNLNETSIAAVKQTSQVKSTFNEGEPEAEKPSLLEAFEDDEDEDGEVADGGIEDEQEAEKPSLLEAFDDEEEDDDDREDVFVNLTVLLQTLKSKQPNSNCKPSMERTEQQQPQQNDHTKKLRRRRKQQVLEEANVPSSHRIVHEVFHTVTKSDIRQASGKPHENAGELSILGTAALIDACEFRDEDVFLDVGSGIGNVVVQVALESNVQACIGVEKRVELAERSKKLVHRFFSKYPHLERVHIHARDICAFNADDDALFEQTSVLFSHNTVFQGEALDAIEQLCCTLPGLRIVILQQPICPRHRPTCMREFCMMYRRREYALAIEVTFTSTARHFHVYDRLISI
jgi:hypothetical protein